MTDRTNALQFVETIPTLPPRRPDSHKGLYGRILVVGGSVGMAGSISLVANAAYRSGAGLVRILCPASAQPIAASLTPCATSAPADETPSGQFALAAKPLLLAEAAGADVLAAGPGMGRSPACARLVAALIAEAGRPVVLDADGLNNLAWLAEHAPRPAGPLVLTPHPGEMKRLLAAFRLDVDPAHDDDSRTRAARALAERLACIVVLKGARTVVTDSSRVYINQTGNPGLSTGGTGDVLTGMIAALIGQQMQPFDAAVLGVCLHGLAGDLAADRLGQISLMATDLLDALPEAFRRHQPN